MDERTLPEIRIITIDSLEEASFARRFLGNIITVSFNKDYVAFSPDASTAFIYSTRLLWNSIISIFQDPTLIKLISKPAPALKSFLGGVIFANCQHISDYMSQKGEQRSISEMKREITEQDVIPQLSNRAGSVALIMMKYKLIADVTHKTPKQQKKSYFNKRRDCYLLYLTAFNDILVRNGPLRFVTLANIVKSYPYLCRIGLSPFMALEGLIKVGALSLERDTTIVSIPDQIPA
jgi:uncharacterized membrane protein